MFDWHISSMIVVLNHQFLNSRHFSLSISLQSHPFTREYVRKRGEELPAYRIVKFI